jgi:hypothetical protein
MSEFEIEVEITQLVLQQVANKRQKGANDITTREA